MFTLFTALYVILMGRSIRFLVHSFIHVGRQAMIAHLAGRMPLQDDGYGSLRRIERNWCGPTSAGLFILRKLETTYLEIRVRAEPALIMVGRTK
jgi:hypothetical protein